MCDWDGPIVPKWLSVRCGCPSYNYWEPWGSEWTPTLPDRHFTFRCKQDSLHSPSSLSPFHSLFVFNHSFLINKFSFGRISSEFLSKWEPLPSRPRHFDCFIWRTPEPPKLRVLTGLTLSPNNKNIEIYRYFGIDIFHQINENIGENGTLREHELKC